MKSMKFSIVMSKAKNSSFWTASPLANLYATKYLIDGLSKWITAWKRNGWRTASGKPVLNKDLWQALDNARLKNVELNICSSTKIYGKKYSVV